MTIYALPQVRIDGTTHPLGSVVEVRLLCVVDEPGPLHGMPVLRVTDWTINKEEDRP